MGLFLDFSWLPLFSSMILTVSGIRSPYCFMLRGYDQAQSLVELPSTVNAVDVGGSISGRALVCFADAIRRDGAVVESFCFLTRDGCTPPTVSRRLMVSSLSEPFSPYSIDPAQGERPIAACLVSLLNG